MSLVQYDKILSRFVQLTAVMVNYACGFNQSETGKIFSMNNNAKYGFPSTLWGV